MAPFLCEGSRTVEGPLTDAPKEAGKNARERIPVSRMRRMRKKIHKCWHNFREPGNRSTPMRKKHWTCNWKWRRTVWYHLTSLCWRCYFEYYKRNIKRREQFSFLKSLPIELRNLLIWWISSDGVKYDVEPNFATFASVESMQTAFVLLNSEGHVQDWKFVDMENRSLYTTNCLSTEIRGQNRRLCRP